jgi:hypothetical protein
MTPSMKIIFRRLNEKVGDGLRALDAIYISFVEAS